MSLTKDDLQSIRVIVESVVEEAIEDSKRQTAAGFEEMGSQLHKLQSTMEQVVRVQKAEVEWVDNHDKAFMRLRKALRTA
jgi:hypothetical protein